MSGAPFLTPASDCGLCPRLAEFRAQNQAALPKYFNGPVPSFGPLSARVLIVGLAPGLHGANRTGRPFTGDWAGDLLFPTLQRHGFACGVYDERADDGLALVDCRIVNGVRCVPPQNKPTPAEIAACRPFLSAELKAMPDVRAAVALGRIAHETFLRAIGVKLKDAPFAHGAVHALPGLSLHDSYHCSLYNTNTGVLTPQMFDEVFANLAATLGKA